MNARHHARGVGRLVRSARAMCSALVGRATGRRRPALLRADLRLQRVELLAETRGALLLKMNLLLKRVDLSR
jgi:hypothetical protein